MKKIAGQISLSVLIGLASILFAGSAFVFTKSQKTDDAIFDVSTRTAVLENQYTIINKSIDEIKGDLKLIMNKILR